MNCGGSARTAGRRPVRPRRCLCRWRTPWNSMPAPWTPTPARTCRPTGRGRPRRWISAQVSRLSRLWFEALAGICAHVDSGGGGLTPSDIAPARLSQQQIDELQQQYRIADVLPLTPLQQGLLFHAEHRAGLRRRCVCGAAGYHRDRPAGSAPAARGGADGGRPASQPGGPVLRTVRRAGADHPGRSRGAVAVCRARRRRASMSMSRSSRCAPPSAPRSATWPTSRPSGRR